jgi:hypothetical protein
VVFARLLLGLGVALAAALTGGCAGRLEPFPESARDRAELTAVPFHPQRTHQCGPAALATLLGHAGVAAAPDELVREVYLPAREGSLQPEIVGAVRRRELVPYLLDGGFAALVTELDAARPVLVLQNLGIALIPYWHYAVVVGYDRGRDALVLRSGVEERRIEGRRIFQRTWARSQQWALVVLTPGEIPASATAARFFAALAAMEAVGRIDVALAGYRAMVARWPAAAEGYFGLGNVLLGRETWAGAEAAYRAALALGEDAAIRNNLAMALLGRGCAAAAIAEAAKALAAVSDDDALRPAIADTLHEALERAAAPDAVACPLPQ